MPLDCTDKESSIFFFVYEKEKTQTAKPTMKTRAKPKRHQQTRTHPKIFHSDFLTTSYRAEF